MGSSNIRDILTSFSPALDYFAICSGDARIKIWDTLKGQVQTEFADIASTETTSLYGNRLEREHLSVDYTCMKWLSVDRKKKRKLGSSLLVLGTGGGDVLALAVSAGQLKWRLSDCHPGGVSAISFATHGSCIYSAGADGMVCEIDPLTGSLLGKFRASTKGISCMAVSSDGKMLATAAGQLKTFNCSDHKKMQKFSGHPGAVRFMTFSDDGKYVLSSAVGERYIALWRTDGVKKQSASCVLAMEHPAVFMDCRCIDNGGVDDAGLYVLAISETGVCYFWYGQNIEELRNTKATKILSSSEDVNSKSQKSATPAIFAAKLQDIVKPASVHTFAAYGLLLKPSFQKILVNSGEDINLNCSQDGVLLPMITALDRANAEDAVLPLPKILDSYDKKNRHQNLSSDLDEVMTDVVDSESQAKFMEIKDDKVEVEAESQTVCMEDRLRSLGILMVQLVSVTPLSYQSDESYYFVSVTYQCMQVTGSLGGPVAIKIQIIFCFFQITVSREAAFQSLLRLSGRLQLTMAQIDRAAQDKMQISSHDLEVGESEDEDDDVEELLYGEVDDESQISSDEDN
ncbi:WD REPEATS REGION domain-containing protein [Citrus sinensis]|uniref:WD REPEATS REGION domain-containing protein n=1 Tax=Citrus sinensis TaxID=2711 RepID=A0ACB8I9L8_CITSI|nr:WD REPEATS REGION domain-containing protein [Citrus sinensis]